MAIVTVEGTHTFGMVGNRLGSTNTALNQANIGYAQGFQFFEKLFVDLTFCRWLRTFSKV